MFYKLTFDMDRIDEGIKEGTNTIYAEADNMDEIEYEGVKKGFFHNVILTPRTIRDWPEVIFYYSSKASGLESDYLLNIRSWPVVHVRVFEEFKKRGIRGVQYLAVKLVDVATGRVNADYVLMYVENFIDAFDLEKSEYVYDEEYDFYTFLPKKTYLNERVCAGYDIFRCAKSVAAVYVSGKIKEIVQENRWTGFCFQKTVDISPNKDYTSIVNDDY